MQFRSHRLPKIFFSSLDRSFASLSFLLSLISFLLTLFFISSPKTYIPTFIVIRDTTIFFGVIFLGMFFFIKYSRRETIIYQQEQLLSDLFKRVHDVVHKSKQDLFKHYYNSSAHGQTIELRESTRQILKDLCSDITHEVRTAVLIYLRSRGIDLDEDIAVSVKLVLQAAQILPLLSRHLTDEEKRLLRQRESENFVITVYRDYHTYQNNKSREIGHRFYDIDDNTVFHDIIVSKREMFLSNNLRSDGSYRNTNEKWRQFYNSTMAVPIRYYSDDELIHKCYGILAVDSRNKKKFKEVFDNGSIYILRHAADLLAIFFLMVSLVNPAPMESAESLASEN